MLSLYQISEEDGRFTDCKVDPLTIVKIRVGIKTHEIAMSEGWRDLVDPAIDFLRAVKRTLCDVFPNAQVEMESEDHDGGAAWDEDGNKYLLDDDENKFLSELTNDVCCNPNPELFYRFARKPVEAE